MQDLATNLRKETNNQISTVMKSEFQTIVNDAPYRTGALRSSGKLVIGSCKGILCKREFSAGHAGFVNVRTIFMLPRHFATTGYNRILSWLMSRI